MIGLNNKTALHRQLLLVALIFALLLPSAGCIVLLTRQNRLHSELTAAQTEIERLNAAAAFKELDAADGTSPEQPTTHTPPPREPDPGAPEYQGLYPDLYSEHPVGEQSLNENVCYLTFDDGPSEQTPVILDILDRYQIKATFFVVGSKVQKHPDILKDTAARGHTIGVHTDTHVYSDIYDSVESYLDDFNAVYQRVVELTDIKPEVFRFPGGSLNPYNKSIYQPLIAEMLRRGFAYYDWNASAEDAVGKPTAQSVTENALKTKSRMPIVLMHDGTYTAVTAEGLPQIIEGFQARSYSFGVLSPEVYSVVFAYKD